MLDLTPILDRMDLTNLSLTISSHYSQRKTTDDSLSPETPLNNPQDLFFKYCKKGDLQHAMELYDND